MDKDRENMHNQKFLWGDIEELYEIEADREKYNVR